MNAKTIAAVQAELASAQWIGRPATTTKSTRGASR